MIFLALHKLRNLKLFLRKLKGHKSELKFCVHKYNKVVKL